MKTPSFKALGYCRFLGIDENIAYFAIGDTVYSSPSAENRVDHFAVYKNSVLRRISNSSRVISRIFRSGITSMALGDNGDMVLTSGEKILHLGSGERDLKRVLSLERGSGPLNISFSKEVGYVFGEYFSNAKRRCVKIYGSRDGIKWHVRYVFPNNTIRHIHGIFHDSYRNGHWVLTGDSNSESGLWFSSDGFESIQKVVSGSQKCRAVSIIPTECLLIVPMDSPLERNYINAFFPTDRIFETRFELPSSAFDAVQVDGIYFVSTVPESSDINEDKYVGLYASLDGLEWKQIAHFARKYPQHLDKYLQYPRLSLPQCTGASLYLYGYATNLREIDGQTLRWSIEEIRECLQM